MTNLDIQSAYLGLDQVDRVYLGTDVVWLGGTPPTPPEPAYSAMPLTFQMYEDGGVFFNPGSNIDYGSCFQNFKYRVNGGTWESVITAPTISDCKFIPLSSGDTCEIIGDHATGHSGDTIGGFNSFNSLGTSGASRVYGNINSLLGGIDQGNPTYAFTGITDLTPWGTYTFQGLFIDYTISDLRSGLRDASDLILPATTLTASCYRNMFRSEPGNSTFTDGPKEYPATTLAPGCYAYMFFRQYGLTGTCETLPAEAYVSECYAGMYCYCSSLIKAPDIIASAITNSVTAPLVNMFSGCSSLSSVTCMLYTSSWRYNTGLTQNWMVGVANQGTFRKHPSMSRWPRNVNGIPTGWTVEDADV